MQLNWVHCWKVLGIIENGVFSTLCSVFAMIIFLWGEERNGNFWGENSKMIQWNIYFDMLIHIKTFIKSLMYILLHFLTDIILLCLWVLLFVGGMACQLYRERASPPFHPPNLTSWHNFKKSVNFVFDKMFACLPMDPDPGGIDVEDRPVWLLRVVYTSKLAWRRLTCKRGDIPESGYESFPRIRRLSQYNDQDPDTRESRMDIILFRIREWKGRVRHYFRRGNERLLQDSEDVEQQREEEEREDESQLLEGTPSCCAFRNSQVVLDDAYTTNT